jgi:hypothetical protein
MLRLALDLLTRSKASLQTHNHNPTHRSKSSAHFCLRTYMRPKRITGNDVPKIVYDLTPGITTYCILQKNVPVFFYKDCVRSGTEANQTFHGMTSQEVHLPSIIMTMNIASSSIYHVALCPREIIQKWSFQRLKNVLH